LDLLNFGHAIVSGYVPGLQQLVLVL